MLRPWLRAALLTASLWLAPIGLAVGAPGDLDTTFGVGGKSLVNLGGSETANALALQPDGRIVVAGSTNAVGGVADQFVARLLNPQGVLDTSYGLGSGWSRLRLGATGNSANAVALQPDGRILVGGLGDFGASKLDGTVARLLAPEGTLDPSYGLGSGSSRMDFGGEDVTTALALQPDGRILALGAIFASGAGPRGTLTRLLNPQGTLDPAFGGGSGFSLLDFTGGYLPKALTLQRDGRIVIAGIAGAPGNPNLDFGIVRLLDPEGTPDPLFGAGGNGKVLLDLGGYDFPAAIVVQPDGRIVVAGTSSGDAAVARLLPNGIPDPSFGTSGKATLDLGGDSGEVRGMALRPDGKIILVANSGGDVVVARLQPNGLLDTTFGTGGRTVLDFGGTDTAGGVALQPDGRVVVVGSSSVSGGEIAVARLQADPPAGPGGTGGGAGAGGGPSTGVPRCAGRPATIIGTAGRDRLKGTGKADVIVGLGGDDRIAGLAGDDIICGGPGADRLAGGAGADRLLGQAGADRLLGGAGRDRLLGGAGPDRLLGGAGIDVLTGGPGKNSRTQ